MRRLLCSINAQIAALGLIWIAGSALANVHNLGEFKVNNTGAATYTVPIAVPPGTNGVAPILSLSYNSQAGNGMMGLGWMLSGISSITRCPQTVAQDGVRGSIHFDGNDRYCMGGQRLMLVSGSYGADGSEYRTELEQFSKIVAHGSAGNGPAWFEVWRKDGRRAEYGNSVESRVEAQGKTSVATWFISKEQDRKGNQIQYGYQEESANGVAYPVTIQYGSKNDATQNKILFSYEQRVDPLLSWREGSKQWMAKRLIAIETQSASTTARKYTLSYEGRPSKLVGLQECGADSVCKEPIKFVWGSGEITAINRLSNSGISGAQYPIHVLGNGKSQIVVNSSSDGGRCSNYSYINYDGSRSTNDHLGVTCNYQSESSSWSQSSVTPYPIDRDGDGKEVMENMSSVYGFSYSSNYPYYGVLDVNGDGKDEAFLLQYQREEWGDSDYSQRTNLYITTPAGIKVIEFGDIGSSQGWSSANSPSDQQLMFGDFNGDGNSDMFMYHAYSKVDIRVGNGVGGWTSYNVGALPGFPFAAGFVVGDYNGDGLQDLIAVDRGGNLYLYWSTGTGFSYAGQFAASIVRSGLNVRAVDFDGDGLTDLGFSGYQAGWSTPYQIMFSNGDGTFREQGYGLNYAEGLRPFADFTGDGKMDLLDSDNRPYGTVVAQPSTAIKEVQQGSQPIHRITYSTLALQGCTPKTGLSYPQRAICNALPVVDVASTVSSNGQEHQLRYRYGGLQADLSGRGLLGFEWVEATDLTRNLKTTTTYNQLWPLTGTIAKVERSGAGVGNSGVLSQETHAYQSISLGNKRYFNGQTEVKNQGWDLNGTVLPTVTRTYTYDCQASTTCYGNQLTENISSSDGFSETSTMTYRNDSAAWVVGLPVRKQQTKTAPTVTPLPVLPSESSDGSFYQTRIVGEIYECEQEYEWRLVWDLYYLRRLVIPANLPSNPYPRYSLWYVDGEHLMNCDGTEKLPDTSRPTSPSTPYYETKATKYPGAQCSVDGIKSIFWRRLVTPGGATADWEQDYIGNKPCNSSFSYMDDATVKIMFPQSW